MNPFIRDYRLFVEALEQHAQRQELTPERFKAIAGAMNGRLDHVEAIVLNGGLWSLDSRGLTALDTIESARKLVGQLMLLHRGSHLPARVFEASIAWMRWAADTLEGWEDMGSDGRAPIAEAEFSRDHLGLIQTQRELEGLPPIRARFVDQGPRHFTVFEGGRP